MTQIGKGRYATKRHTTSGCEHGASRSSEGDLEVRLSTPGSTRIGADPAQLFAAGCEPFDQFRARRRATGPHPSPSGGIARTWSETATRLSLLAAGTMVCASAAFAQTASEVPGPAAPGGTTAAGVVPVAEAQPPARIVVDPPLAEPLGRGVAVLQYRSENLRIVPVFGSAALAVSPRVGHLHVTVDDLPWDWADASGAPIIIQNLPPGPHRVLIELADANHHILDHRAVEFVVPDVGQRSQSTTHAGSR